MNGSVIGAVNLPTLASATGVWNIEEVKLAQQQSIWPPYFTPDPYWEYVSLLLSGETATTNGAQNNTFLDSSTNNFTLSRNGNTTQGSFSPYGSNWSGYFDGGANRITTGTSSQFNLASSNFTLECWVFMTSYPNGDNRFITIGPNDAQSSLEFTIKSTGVYGVGIPKGGQANVNTGSNIIPLNTWTHLAFTLDSDVGSVYINGVRYGQSSGWNFTSSSSNYLYVGYDSTPTVDYKFTGYVSNVRLVVGSALYSGTTFTVPTSPLTAVAGTKYLSCQDNRLLDNSVNNFSLGVTGAVPFTKFSPFNLTYQNSFSYGAYFDGTGDYLSTPSNVAFSPGTGDFTIECWMYQTAATGEGTLFYVNATGGINLFTSIGGNWGIARAGVAVDNNFGAPPAFNTWNHLAVSRSGSTIKAFINGSQVFSGTNTSNYTTGSSLIASSNSFGTITGYISNLRLVKGTAVYTSNFTPPTTQLTAITGTSLLVCQSSTFIDNSTNNFTITVNGNTIPTTFSPFTNTYSSLPYSVSISELGGSSYFDGTGDYLTIPYSQSIVQWWDTNYTIEMWVRNTLNRQTGIGVPTQIAYGAPTSDTTYWSFGTNGTGRLYFYYFNGGQVVNAISTVGVTVPLNVWTHIAMVYNNTTGNLNGYINGKLAFSVAKQGTPQGASGFTLNIGAVQNVSYNGYISSIRIVRGTAVYTNDFVPLLTPLTAITNTQLLCNFTNGGIIDSSTINDTETVGNAQVNTTTKKYGSGSYYFDGTGDYLNVISIGVIGTTDFTCEGWFYHTSAGQAAIWWDTATSGYASSNFSIRTDYIDSSRSIYCNVGGVSTTFSYTNAVVFLNNWVHVALVRSGNTLKLYLNGNAASGTGTLNTTSVDLTNFKVAGAPSPTSGYSNFTGYISDFRFTRGIARYTANFTPPATSLPRF
jgi:hypothetical protein